MNHIGMKRDGGYTSLMMASSSGHADVVRALIEADPSPKHIQMKVRALFVQRRHISFCSFLHALLLVHAPIVPYR